MHTREVRVSFVRLVHFMRLRLGIPILRSTRIGMTSEVKK